MSSPKRQSRRPSQAADMATPLMNEDLSPVRVSNSRVCVQTTMPGIFAYEVKFAASRIANTQPTYDFITGAPNSHPVQPLRQTFRQSQVTPGEYLSWTTKSGNLTDR